MSAFVSALMGAAKYIPASQLLGIIKKKIPNLGKFINSSLSSGLTATQIADFFHSSLKDKSFLRHLDQMNEQGRLTPEEKALRRKEKTSEGIQRFATDLASFGVGSMLGAMGGDKLSPTEEGEEKDFKETAQDISKVAQGAGIAQKKTEPSLTEKIIGDVQKQAYDPLSALAKFPRLLRFIRDNSARGMGISEIVRRARGAVPLRMEIEEIERNIDEPFESWISRLINPQSRQEMQDQMGAMPAQSSSPKKAELIALMNKMQQQMKNG